jgi:hypothetical protein
VRGTKEDPIRLKFFTLILLILVGAVACRRHASQGDQSSSPDTAYVLPTSLEVVDAPGEIRLEVESVKAGDRVRVLERARNWAKIRLADGRTGWVECKDLLDEQSYEASQKLLRGMENLPAQAQGHAPQSINLRFEPSRDSASLAQLPNNQKLEVFGRRLVARPSQSDRSSSAPVKEVWYLVRTDQRAGWVLGRSVSLDIPEPLGTNVQGYNLVAWLVLNTVADGGRQVPQYIAADRAGNQEADFTHIRVFTWWVKNQQYVTSYAESGLHGYFPIRVVQAGKVPNFRLNLVDKDGNKVQKVYGLFNTITRPLGFVEGWESNATPTRPPSGRLRHR